MEATREKWTDGRLDDMNERINEGINRLDHELRDVRAEVRDVRSEVAGVRQELNRRFDAIQQMMLRLSAGLFGTMAIGFVGIIVS